MATPRYIVSEIGPNEGIFRIRRRGDEPLGNYEFVGSLEGIGINTAAKDVKIGILRLIVSNSDFETIPAIAGKMAREASFDIPVRPTQLRAVRDSYWVARGDR